MYLRLAAIAVALGAPAFAQDPHGHGPGGPAEAPKLTPDEEKKILYALGVEVGRSLQAFVLTAAELEQVKKGMTDQVLGKKIALEMQQWGPRIQDLHRARAAKRADADKAKADKEKEASKAFLDKAAKEKGAQKTASGLIFTEQKAGTGNAPAPTDRVKVHYKGTLIDGTEFDSSYKRGEPAEFALNQVIPCWTEGVQKLKPGGAAKLVCPSSIAYGDRGAPPTIPPGATLVFTVELLEVKK